MSLRDTELDVALILQEAGLGSLEDGQPDLFAGPFPSSAPDALVCCRRTDADKPEKYLGAVGLRLHRERVRVLVRGGSGPDAYKESGDRARAAWSALFEFYPDEYVQVDPDDGGPSYDGVDDERRPLWSFAVGLEYVSATAGGVVVPLSREATLSVGGLEVTGDAHLARLLVLGTLPFSSFPDAEGCRGALLFDTDSGLLRVSDGSTWRPLGEPPVVPTAGEVAVTPAGELTAGTVQGALEELQLDVQDRATALQLQALGAELETKADAAAVDDLADLVASKASQVDLDSLELEVAGKADTAAVSTALALKADASAVSSGLAAKADLVAVNAALALKADSSALGGHTAASSAHGVTGTLVGTSDEQTLSNKTHSGRLNVINVAGSAVALALPVGAWLKLASSGSNADVLYSDGTSVFVGSGGSGSLSLSRVVVGTELVLQGRLLRSSNSGTIVYQAAADGGASAPVGHRFTTSVLMAAGTPVLEVSQKTGAAGADQRKWGVDPNGKVLVNAGDSSSVPGNATLNAPFGKSTIPAGASSIVITNACCTSNSLVRAWVMQASEDATLVRVRAAPGSGSLTIYGNAAATAAVVVAWEVIN